LPTHPAPDEASSSVAREPIATEEELPREAERVLGAARAGDISAKAVGGLAVYLRCESARRPPLSRSYQDLDLAIPQAEANSLGDLLTELGYRPDREFNALQGHLRQLYWDDPRQRQLDVFVDRMVLCHTLDLRDAFRGDELTLPLADLLLAKLQVVETNEKDFKDAAALLADHELSEDAIDPGRITGLLSHDWGWWRTVTESLDKLSSYVSGLPGFSQGSEVTARIERLKAEIEAAPKTMRWRLRARVGERMTWYELPEEVEH
jgi:hypothetical protein